MNMNLNDLKERQVIQGNVILINKGTDDIFGNIPYTVDGHNIKIVSKFFNNLKSFIILIS